MKKKSIIAFVATSLFSPSLLFALCDSKIPRNKPDVIYKDFGNGLVLDTKTRLLWQKCSMGQIYSAGTCIGSPTTYSWYQAMNIAVTANAAGMLGYSDWRLPNAKEIFSLSDLACKEPAINTTVFPGVEGLYWTSSAYTPSATAPDLAKWAYIQSSDSGIVGGNRKDYDIAHVRLVRNKN